MEGEEGGEERKEEGRVTWSSAIASVCFFSVLIFLDTLQFSFVSIYLHFLLPIKTVILH